MKPAIQGSTLRLGLGGYLETAALVLGILAGLSSLPLATYAHGLLALGGGNGGALYFIPLLSFLGAGLALNIPALSAACLGLSAFILLVIGGKFGYAVDCDGDQRGNYI